MANGTKDNSSRLWRGLHSVLDTQLDHPLGPPTCSAGAHICRRQSAHAELGFVRHGDSLLSAPRQLCLLGSSGNDILLRPLLRHSKAFSLADAAAEREKRRLEGREGSLSEPLSEQMV